METNGNGGEHIAHVVRSDEPRAHLQWLRCEGRGGLEREMEEGGTGDQCATDVGGRVRTIGDYAVKLTFGSHLHQVGIALVEKEQGAMGPHEIIEFTFRPFYTLEGPEALQMGTADIGNHATGRLNIIHKLLYVARMGGSHLHNRYLMFRRDLKQRTRHAYIVVVVGLGVEHTVFLAKTAETSSLVVVLPLVPVMPMTGMSNWRRCSRASSL